MHIPDGYLSPQTCLIMYGAAAPFWYQAGRRVKKALRSQSAPLLAVFAAASFTIQMFNFPVPPGTTAHVVGGTLVAIALGPSAAIVGVSVALVIQALFFGDGGITTIGANAFNMAVALPLSSYAVYSLLARGAKLRCRRRIIAAAVAAYVGINVAGLLGAVELGIQPLLWTVDGRPLYNPYGLATTIPAIAFTHLTLAGFAEAALTAFALGYLLRSHPALFASSTDSRAIGSRAVVPKALIAGLAVLILLVPFGLLADGTAQFEWGSDELKLALGYAPAGLQGLANAWTSSPLVDYQVHGLTAQGFAGRAAGYALSAVLGVALIFAIALAIGGTRPWPRRLQRSPEGKRALSQRRPVCGTGNFVAKTIAGVTGTLERTIFNEEQARLPGLLQRADPRAKVVGAALLLLAVGLLRGLVGILILYAFVLVFAHLSKLRIAVFMKRVWIGIPLFASLIAIPAMFTVPGDPVLVFARFGDTGIAISDNGLATAAVFIARVATSVSLALLLVLTTRWAQFLKALRVLRMPEAFLVVLGMTYRYLFLFLHLANNLFLARQSRTVGRASGSEQRHWAAAASGSMFARSILMSVEVHQAMVARGFNGEVRTIAQRPLLVVDWLIMLGAGILAAATLVIDRGLG